MSVPLRTRRGVAIAAVLCTVQFLDILDMSIMNVALPSIQRDLRFSQQSLQWVISGYMLSYGGCLLLGGRLADVLGRRRILISGLSVFPAASLAGALAPGASFLVAARLVQGAGAALMAPAALSILTTTFDEANGRNTVLAIWGAVTGVAGAAGVLFGGVLTRGLGWRSVLLVNVPICLVALVATFMVIPDGCRRRGFGKADAASAALLTGGMLILVHALVGVPRAGWGSPRTIGELLAAAALLTAFTLTERCRAAPLVPLSILRISGLAAADATMLIAFAGFYAMFFFLTLYMQEILRYSPIQAGSAYLPVTAGIVISAGTVPLAFPYIGTRPFIAGGPLLSAVGVFCLSRIPVHGSYLVNVLPGLLIMSIGLGAVFVAVTTAANGGVSPDQAGLAAGLLNTSQQLGAALGLAALSVAAAARTAQLLAAGAAQPVAATAGYQRAFQYSAILLVAAGLTGTRGRDCRPPVSPLPAGRRIPPPSA